MATVFTGNAVQRITEQDMELFGSIGIFSSMLIEKYVKDANVQKHIAHQVPLKFRITETQASFKRNFRSLLVGGN